MSRITPSRLGRYEIVGELGKGAMGVVYLAKDPIIGRLVALKTFRAGFTESDAELHEFRARFIREAQSAGILSHPNVVTIHDVVERSEEGVTFIAMEYVQGTNLKEMLQAGEAMDLPWISSILGQVAEGLDYAHSKGVIHRDIKPANIIITPQQQVKLTDFGIARVDDSNLTHDGQLLGTPNYMAPEQIRGQEIDHRSDLFSMGVVLYEMITRRKPFQGDSLSVVTYRIVYEDFTPPETYVRELPAAISEVLARALAKNPGERYQSAGELARSFAAAKEGQPSRLRRAEDDPSATQDVTEFQLPPPPADSEIEPTVADDSATPQGIAARGPLVARLRAELRTPPSPLRLSLVAGATLLFALSLAAAASFLVQARQPPVERPSPADLLRARYLPLMKAARRQLARGRPSAALDYLDRATRIAPDEPVLTQMRDLTQLRLQEVLTRQRRREKLLELMSAARGSLASRRYEEAVMAAGQAAALEPRNGKARSLLDESEEALTRARRQAAVAALAPTPAAEPSSPTAGEETALAEEAAARAEPAVFTLKVDFVTHIGEGVFTLYADDEQIYRESFDFVKKRGPLAKLGSKLGFVKSAREGDGRIETSHQLPRGVRTIRAYVTIKGFPTRVAVLDRGFHGGTSHTLHLELDVDGNLKARLD